MKLNLLVISRASTGHMQPKTTMQTWVLRSSCLFNKCLDKHTPLKTVSKIRERVLQKPSITNGIKTSIKVRDKLYKQTIKHKDAILKNQKQMLYKRYISQQNYRSLKNHKGSLL